MTAYRERTSKYRNARTEYNGQVYDSKFEAGVARDLDIRLRAGEIAGWERQYQVICIPFDSSGKPVLGCSVRHKVDFRVHELDGTYTLTEAKGLETADYKMRRRWLLDFWLPSHPDHTYMVLKDRKRCIGDIGRWRKRRCAQNR